MLSKYDLKKKLNEENIKYTMDKLYEKNIIPIKYISNFQIRYDDDDYYNIIFLYSIEKEKMKLIKKKILCDLYKNILKIIIFYEYLYEEMVVIPYNDIIEMSTLLLIKNCNNNEEEDNKIFDIFWEVYLDKVNDLNHFRMFNNLGGGDIRIKKEVVDKHFKDITLKNKIHRYIDNKLIPKEKQIIRKDKIEAIKNINLDTVHDIISKFNEESDNFDPLIIAIENNISNDIIFKIMEEYLSIHKSFDYFIEKEYYNDGYSCKKNTPLFIAIAKNNFEIASYLLKLNIITYSEINIIKYLLSRKLVNDNRRESDYIIEKWIKASENVFLVLYIKGFFIENNIEIEYDYYEKALRFKNYNAILILFNYDKNGDYNIFKLKSTIIVITLKINLLDLLSKCKIKNNFKNENFYNSKFTNVLNNHKFEDVKINNKNIIKSNNFNEIDTNFSNKYWFNNELYVKKLRKDRTLYLNESTYESIKSRILEINKLYESWNPERDLPNQENIEEFKEYIINNKEIIIKFNKVSCNFDLLIYSIENNYPFETIKYIINNFNYKSFDYGLEGKDIYFYSKTPLFEAISKENFELADFLLDKGATLNKVNTIKFLMSEGSLKPNVIIYLFLKDYNVSEKEDSYYMINTWIEKKKNIILEMYLNYFNIKKIRKEYYYMAIEKRNIDALIILYRYDKRPNKTILEEIFNILDINFYNVDEAKKFILDSEQEFQEDKFYYNIFQNIKNENKKNYEKLKNDLIIDKEKYVTYGKEIKEFFKQKNSISEKKIQFIRQYDIFSNLDEFKKYFKNQEIKLNEFNDSDVMKS